MLPGCEGTGVTVTLIHLWVLEPQALFAVTQICPLLALAVAVMEFVVELPVHPVGSVQV